MVKCKEANFSSFVCFDFETTGLGRDDKIIEIGAVKVIDGYMVARYSSLVDPKVPIDPLITKITGITNEMVQGKPTIEELIPSFYEFVQDLPMVAHNAPFDCRFLERDSKACGFYFDNGVFDTLRFMKYRCESFPGLMNNKLCTACEYFGITSEVFHRADADAEVTAKLYLALQKNGKIKKK